MEELLGCDTCLQVWDASEGDMCKCGRAGKPISEIDFGPSPEFVKFKKPRKRICSNYIRLSVHKNHVSALYSILFNESSRVMALPDDRRTDHDNNILACAEELVQRLRKAKW